MGNSNKRQPKHLLAIVHRIILLLMIEEKKFGQLNQLRQETIIGEMINETLRELAELGMIRVTGNKSLPFELTAKGDAATDISFFKGQVIFLRLPDIEETFNNWLQQMRKKQKKGDKNDSKTGNQMVYLSRE